MHTQYALVCQYDAIILSNLYPATISTDSGVHYNVHNYAYVLFSNIGL